MSKTKYNSQIFVLPDGRKLCFIELGDLDGFPILYCHGFPASRIEASLATSAAQKFGVRIISVDRPGYGGSDFQSNRKISDWPEDIKLLFDYLKIDEFRVLGISGGGPYALCCAVHFGQRVKALGVVCGLGPLHAAKYTSLMRSPIAQFAIFARDFPKSANFFYSQAVSRLMKNLPGQAINVIAKFACKADNEVLQQSFVRTTIISTIREAFRQGGKGPAWDFQLYTRNWEFDPADIEIPTYIWHGDQDKTVPVIMSSMLANQITQSNFIKYSNEGHFSLPINRIDEIIGKLLT